MIGTPIALKVYNSVSQSIAFRIVNENCNNEYPTIVNEKLWDKYRSDRSESKDISDYYLVSRRHFSHALTELPYDVYQDILYLGSDEIAKITTYRLYAQGPVARLFPGGGQPGLQCPNHQDKKYVDLINNEFSIRFVRQDDN